MKFTLSSLVTRGFFLIFLSSDDFSSADFHLIYAAATDFGLCLRIVTWWQTVPGERETFTLSRSRVNLKLSRAAVNNLGLRRPTGVFARGFMSLSIKISDRELDTERGDGEYGSAIDGRGRPGAEGLFKV